MNRLLERGVDSVAALPRMTARVAVRLGSIARQVRSRFSGQVMVTSGTNVALLGLGLLTGALGAHLLGPGGRGQLAAIQLWAMTAVALGSCGLQEAIVYYCARDPEKSGETVTTAVGLLCLISPIWVVAGVVAMPHLLAAEPAIVIFQAQLYMAIVPIFFVVFAGYAAVRGRGDFTVWNRWRLSLPAGYAIVLILSAFIPASRVTFVAFGYLAWVALHLVFAAWAFARTLQGQRRWQPARVRPLVRYGALSVGANGPGALNQRLDQLVMGAFIPAHLLGLYAVAVTWSAVATLLSNAFSQVILQRLASTRDPAEARNKLAQASRIACGSNVVIGVLMLAGTPWALAIICGPLFAPAIPAALVLVVAAAFLGQNLFLEEAVRGLGRPGLAAAAELSGLFVTAPGLYVLLPRWGIMGAAAASLAAYAFVTVLLVGLLWRYAGVHPLQLLIPRRSDLRTVGSRLGLVGQVA